MCLQPLRLWHSCSSPHSGLHSELFSLHFPHAAFPKRLASCPRAILSLVLLHLSPVPVPGTCGQEGGTMIGLLPEARILSPLPLQTGHSPQLLINHSQL